MRIECVQCTVHADSFTISFSFDENASNARWTGFWLDVNSYNVLVSKYALQNGIHFTWFVARAWSIDAMKECKDSRNECKYCIWRDEIVFNFLLLFQLRKNLLMSANILLQKNCINYNRRENFVPHPILFYIQTCFIAAGLIVNPTVGARIKRIFYWKLFRICSVKQLGKLIQVFRPDL